jgi:4'-phosphopantetheinyl transferase
VTAGAPTIRWHACQARDVPRGDAWLSERERACLEPMRFVKRRRDWRLGRWAAKQALSMHLDVGPEAIEILAAADGAPEAFAGGAPAGVGLSISHRGGAALCAIAPGGTRIGCDLELIEPRSDAFLEDYLLPTERRAVARAAGRGEAMAALVWSGKESALKALRAGLRRDTRSVEVSLPLAVEGSVWVRGEARCRLTGAEFALWGMIAEGRVLTLATDAPRATPAAAPISQKKVAKSSGQVLRSALLYKCGASRCPIVS